MPLYHACTSCWEISTDTLVQNVCKSTSLLISTLVPLALNLPMNYTCEVLTEAKLSLPLQLGFERYHYISLN